MPTLLLWRIAEISMNINDFRARADVTIDKFATERDGMGSAGNNVSVEA